MDLLNLLWLFFIFSSLTPLLQQRVLEYQRLRLLRQLEKRRGSRVIGADPPPGIGPPAGIPIPPWIDIENSAARVLDLTL